MSVRSNTLAALLMPEIRSVHFMYNSRLIAPLGFAFVAVMVSDGRIACTVDASLTNKATYDPMTDTITARDNSYGELLDEKSVLVHECTHALLDAMMGARSEGSGSSSMKVLEDETTAYLAGAIFSLETKLTHGATSPSKEAIEIVRPKLEEIKKHPQWTTGCVSMRFTAVDVIKLKTAILKHEFYRGCDKETAVHNGMLRPKAPSSPF